MEYQAFVYSRRNSNLEGVMMVMRRVYHFCSAKHGLSNLENNHLKIATIQDLNDPFEMLSHDLADPKVRKAVLAIKQDASEQIGLFCFSSAYSNPVQWAHYADKHKGICLGFDVEEADLIKVNYSSSRLNMNPADVMSDEGYNQWMTDIISTKYSHWRYEKEYRVFVDISEKDRSQGIMFQPLEDRIMLRQVVVGCNSKLSRKDIEAVLYKYEQPVEVFKVRTAFRRFTMVRNKKTDLWI
ncbi:DUF2971 domain-containing protein [Pseudomonas syringae]|uniref:DUF2971 domain-containing protein n=1 Tax=Pseudomonas syringae TaxID=317 RepID=UPI001EFD0BB1|nr:DUF2971 domain-containing protein [Pseudomonas syringae]